MSRKQMNQTNYKEALESTKNSSSFVRSDLAKSTNDVEILEILSTDCDGYVKYCVAINKHTPIQVLASLANEEEDIVSIGLLKNPKTPIDIVRRLVTHPNGTVAKMAVNTKLVPAHSEDSSLFYCPAYVRSNYANMTCNPEILELLANDIDRDIRRGVASNRHTPIETLASLVNDEEEIVLIALLKNRKTPISAISQIVNHSNPTIAKKASEIVKKALKN